MRRALNRAALGAKKLSGNVDGLNRWTKLRAMSDSRVKVGAGPDFTRRNELNRRH